MVRRDRWLQEPVSAHSHGTSDFASHLGSGSAFLRAKMPFNHSELQFPVLSTEDHVSATRVAVKSKDYIRKETSAPWVLCTVPGTNSSGYPMTSACSSTSESPLPVS